MPDPKKLARRRELAAILATEDVFSERYTAAAAEALGPDADDSAAPEEPPQEQPREG